MSVGEVSGLIAAISFALMSAFTSWMLFQFVKTISILNQFLDDVRNESVPLVSRLQTTIDHVNTQLDRVDGIMTAAESISNKANNATKVVQEVITSPLVKAMGITAGATKAFGKWKKE